MVSEWGFPQCAVNGVRRQTTAYQTPHFRKTILAFFSIIISNMYVGSAKDLALHETEAIKKVKTSELRTVTGAIRPFDFQLSC